jgi:hypothetical protein
MAKKTNVMELAQQSWGQAEVGNRWPEPVSPALYLMQLRLPKLRISTPKKKLPVIMDSESHDGFPQSVKIRHIA